MKINENFTLSTSTNNGIGISDETNKLVSTTLWLNSIPCSNFTNCDRCSYTWNCISEKEFLNS